MGPISDDESDDESGGASGHAVPRKGCYTACSEVSFNAKHLLILCVLHIKEFVGWPAYTRTHRGVVLTGPFEIHSGGGSAC